VYTKQKNAFPGRESGPFLHVLLIGSIYSVPLNISVGKLRFLNNVLIKSSLEKKHTTQVYA
jgi:hypothetical protein